jgi:hypothetical protein
VTRVACKRFCWSLWLSVLVAGVFVVVDLSFVTANI